MDLQLCFLRGRILSLVTWWEFFTLSLVDCYLSSSSTNLSWHSLPGQTTCTASPWCGTSCSLVLGTSCIEFLLVVFLWFLLWQLCRTGRDLVSAEVSGKWTTFVLCTITYHQIQSFNEPEPGLVSSGVKSILENHPNSFLYPVVFATLKSSGFMIVKYCEQILLSGLSKAFVLPHHATKTMVVAACLLTAQQMDMLSVDYNDLFCGLVLFAVIVRLVTSWVFTNWDPYCGVESHVCNLVYGYPDTSEEKDDELKKND